MLRALITSTALVSVALPASADVAVLLGFGSTSRSVERAMTRSLRDADFSVVVARSADPDTVADALAEGFGALEDHDRIIVYMGGTTVRSGSRSFQLSAASDNTTSFSAGREGTELGPVLDALAGYPGRSVLMLSSAQDVLTLGSESAVRVPELPAGVALVEGRPRQLSDGLDLLVGEEAISVARAFAGVDVSGYAPSGVAFTPATPAIQPEPEAEQASEEDVFWDLTQAIGSEEAYRSYIQRYPRGAFVAQAQAAIAAQQVTPEEAAQAAEEALGLTRNDRRAVQTDLVLLGYNTRGIDGLFGPGSRRAITSWQGARGFDQTGFLSRNQLIALRGQADQRRAEIAAEDEAFWARTGATGAEDELRRYLERYPEGRFANTARADLAEIEAERQAEEDAREAAAWERTRADDTPEGYRDFLRRFPEGRFEDDARARLTALTEPEPEEEELTVVPQAVVEQDRAEEREVLANPITRILAERQLAALGLNTGPIDGRFTNQTRQAVAIFQDSRGLPPTGFISRRTGVALLASAQR